jgi:hypothetical protein
MRLQVPVCHQKAGNVFVMGGVVGYEGKAVFQAKRGDEDVRVVYHDAAPGQVNL